MHNAYIGGCSRTNITHKASDEAENLQLYSCSVLPPEIVMHDDAYIGGHSKNNTNASYMMISGGRTKQLDIFCRITGFTIDFLSFIVVELIPFFYGAFNCETVRK